MFFSEENGVLTARSQYETLRIEAWGKDALRVRATQYSGFSGRDWALSESPEGGPGKAKVEILEGQKIEMGDVSFVIRQAVVTNGRISVRVNPGGVLFFYRDGELILQEYSRNYMGNETGQSACLKVDAREFKPIIGGDYSLTVRFDGRDGEKIFGMGQYQQSQMDLKGCTLELAQRNSQISIPFALSSLGYGFLWNTPAIGRATFGNNYTEWHAEAVKEMDYWITVGDTPAEIEEKYTSVTGRAPVMPEHLLGLWQCKLRYRTQEEVLSVARKYHELGIPLDVIVIDFFHWTRQGDWQFDPEYWPDPRAMCDELHVMGTKVMVSVWPTVDKKSVNYYELLERGLLVRTERGGGQTYDYQGDCTEIDVTNPEARAFLWEKCRKNYLDYGIDMFWLDNIEPDLVAYDFDNFRYYLGPALEVNNIYPQMVAKAFCDGMEAEGRGKDMVHLARCGWVGNQKYATLLWSGDVPSTFEALRDQIAAGLNIGLAGIPWWTTDIGGFQTRDCFDPAFTELLLRWFAFAVYCPILRMHGNRAPYDIPPLSDKDYGGGYLYTGHDNELWSYGEEAFEIMKAQLARRLELKPYIASLMEEASETGAPLMRTMFYEFPEDERCWELSDQYMFGPKYLVAPVLHAGEVERTVYLPKGNWRNVNDGSVCEGGKEILCDAPIAYIPVFERLGK